MAVPPESAMLVVAYREVVRKRVAGQYGVLRKAYSAVHSILVLEKETVPVQRYTFVRQVISDVDYYSIARSGFD